MSDIRRLTLVLAAASLIPIAAAAQSKPSSPSPGGGSQPGAGAGGGGFSNYGPQPPQQQFRQDFLTQAWTYHLTRLTGYKRTKETDLANRVSILIDAGDCKGAEALARAEHDPSMAFKVPAVCDAKRRGSL